MTVLELRDVSKDYGQGPAGWRPSAGWTWPSRRAGWWR